MHEVVQTQLVRSNSVVLLVVPDFMGGNHPEGTHRHQLALAFNRMHCVGQPILLSVVFRHNFDGFLLIGVLVLLGRFLLLLAFGLQIEEDGLRVAGEGRGVEVIGVGTVEGVGFGKFAELEVVAAGWGRSYA